jgi:hypothetical protein
MNRRLRSVEILTFGVGGGVVALGYLIAIVFIFGPPQAVALMKHVFGM